MFPSFVFKYHDGAVGFVDRYWICIIQCLFLFRFLLTNPTTLKMDIDEEVQDSVVQEEEDAIVADDEQQEGIAGLLLEIVLCERYLNATL
jgi:hypothetical protein